MHLPVLPSFDEALFAGLRALGVPALALLLIMTAFAVKSWIDGIRQVHKGAKAVASVAQDGAKALQRMPAAQRAGGIVVTVLVLCGQLLLLELCYIIGNFLWGLVNIILGRQPQGWTVSQAFGYPVQPLPIMASGLHLNIISGAYLAFGVFCLAYSYWLAAHRIAPDAAGQILALPVTLPGKLVAAIWRFVIGFLILGLVLNLSAHALTPGYQALPVPILLEIPLILLPVAALYWLFEVSREPVARLITVRFALLVAVCDRRRVLRVQAMRTRRRWFSGLRKP